MCNCMSSGKACHCGSGKCSCDPSCKQKCSACPKANGKSADSKQHDKSQNNNNDKK